MKVSNIWVDNTTTESRKLLQKPNKHMNKYES